MKAIHIKLWRDLTRLRAQVATIAMVVAIGVAGFVGMFSVHASLLGARDAFYQDNRLADVFGSVKRAPVHLCARLAAIDGVTEVQLGNAMDAQIDLPGVVPPVTGRFIGLDLARVHTGRQSLNSLTLRSGRWPERSSPATPCTPSSTAGWRRCTSWAQRSRPSMCLPRRVARPTTSSSACTTRCSASTA
jgi:putative ABC transport system permease protein